MLGTCVRARRCGGKRSSLQSTADKALGPITINHIGSEFESRWGQEFSLLHVVQTGSGVHPTSYTMGTGGFSPEVKRPVLEAYHSPPTSAEVKKTWIYTFTSPYVFMS
jgi:hypothetical protein